MCVTGQSPGKLVHTLSGTASPLPLGLAPLAQYPLNPLHFLLQGLLSLLYKLRSLECLTPFWSSPLTSFFPKS